MGAKNATKNLLIKTDKDLVDEFKVCSFMYYKDNGLLSLFSFRHFMMLVLLNIQNLFLEKYGKILSPDEEYLNFYKRKGKKITFIKEERILESINFLLPLQYAQLYYDLMHTFYINEKSNSPNFSISIFFEFIVSFIKQNANNLSFFELKL